jgi:hypothetical protein
MYEPSNPADIAAIMQAAAAMDNDAHVPVTPAARVPSPTPVAATTPGQPVSEPVEPVEPAAPAPGEAESLVALEARLIAAHDARNAAAAAEAAKAARLEAARMEGEEVLRSALGSRGIDYNPDWAPAQRIAPPVSQPRAGHNEPAAAPMSESTLHALRLLQHNLPDFDLWGTRTPGSRR